MVALHTWLAIRWRSFTVAVSIGMSATVMGFLIGQSERFGHWYPWSMPLQVLAGKGQWTSFVVAAGLAGGLLAGLAGLADFRRREFA
jgi:lantibiotic transport system permease protein